MERRIITPEEAQRQQDGGTRVAPGLWLDAAGDLHVSVPELLMMVSLPDTPENREQVATLVEMILGRSLPTVIRQDVRE